MSWEDVAFILRSRQRKEIILLLESPKTPTQLSKHLKASVPNTSLKLAALLKKGLVECVNPKDSKGRIYKLTKRGEAALEMIKDMEKKRLG